MKLNNRWKTVLNNIEVTWIENKEFWINYMQVKFHLEKSISYALISEYNNILSFDKNLNKSQICSHTHKISS